MEDSLTTDEFLALEEIGKAATRDRPSACVARNAKRLNGLKYVRFVRNNQLELTEKGTQILFVKRCIDGLRAVSGNPAARLDSGVATFLAKKGHIAPGAKEGEWQITERGRESLADIEAGTQASRR